MENKFDNILSSEMEKEFTLKKLHIVPKVYYDPEGVERDIEKIRNNLLFNEDISKYLNK